MDAKNLLKKYYSRLVKEGLLKAVMLGLIIGFSVLFITATIWFFTAIDYVWLCLVFFGVTTGVSIPIVYYKVFRPTIKKTAKRIDALGLEERVLTMTQFENESDFIILKQRQDTTSALKRVNEKLISFTISIALVVALAVTTVFGTGMMTVAAFVDGNELINPPAKPVVYEVNYEVMEDEEEIRHGRIEGEISQKVDAGSETSPVMAIAEDNWVFAGWMIGILQKDRKGEDVWVYEEMEGAIDPYRIDTDVSRNMTVFALFEKLMPNGDEDGNDDKDKGEGDSASREQTTGDPTEEPTDDPGESEGGGEGGAYEDRNQVIDGETYYGDNVFDNAYNDAKNEMANNNDMSKGEKDFVEEYLKSIEK